MADVKVVLSPDPIFLQGSGGDPTSYDAASDRKFIQDAMGEGIRDLPGHFQASVVSGMTARFAAGVAYIRGKNTADQGTYRQYRAVDTDISAPASHGSLPRLDQVILRVMDYTHDNNPSALYEGRLEWIEGTATAGATLDNRNGAADLTNLAENSKSCILIYDYLMPAGASSITAGNFRDKRVGAKLGQGLASITPTGIMDADISASAAIAISKLQGYPADSGKFLRGDGTWQPIVVPSPKYAKGTGTTTGNSIASLTTVVDNGGFWSSGTPTRFTIPQTGYYLVHLYGSATDAASWVDINVRLNGTAVSGSGYGANTKHNAMWFGPVNAGQYFDAQANGWNAGSGTYVGVAVQLSIIQIV